MVPEGSSQPGNSIQSRGEEHRCSFRWHSSRMRIGIALGTALAWAVFGAGFLAAVVFVALGIHASPGKVLLVLAAGSRLSAYVGATVGEIGFLRGIWLDSYISARDSEHQEGELVGLFVFSVPRAFWIARRGTRQSLSACPEATCRTSSADKTPRRAS